LKDDIGPTNMMVWTTIKAFASLSCFFFSFLVLKVLVSSTSLINIFLWSNS